MQEEFAKSLQQSVNNQFGKGVQPPLFVQYQVLQPLKRGGHGYVYKAKIIKQDKLVALKALPKSHISFDFSCRQTEKKHQTSPQLIKIALNEIKVHESVKSNFVVRLYKWFEDEYNLNMILDYYPKGDLGELMRQCGKPGLPIERVRKIGWSIAKGIHKIHECNVVHRDIKPANILMANEDEIKICDFSCAVKVNGKKSDVTFKKVMGTFSYMAPEIVSKPCEYKLDVWSFGVLLYEICAGELPFKHSNHSLTEIHKMINGTQLLNLQFPTTFSKPLKNLLGRIFVIDPNDRISMTDIVSHHFFTGQTPPDQHLEPTEITSSRQTKRPHELNKQTHKIAAYPLRNGKNYRNTCVSQSLQTFNRQKPNYAQLSSIDEPNRISPSIIRPYPNNYLDVNKENKGHLTNENPSQFNKKPKTNKMSSSTSTITKPHPHELPRKTTNRMSPLNCEGLFYEFDQRSDQKITIDQTGFTKHYLRKNNYKRYHISPKGTHIELTINDSMKRYNLSTLPEKHIELYDQFKECVNQIKARGNKGGSCNKRLRDFTGQLNQLMQRKLKAASSDKPRRGTTVSGKQMQIVPREIAAKYSMEFGIGWNLLLEIRYHKKEIGKNEIYLIFKASQPPQVLGQVPLVGETVEDHQLNAFLNKYCPVFDKYGAESTKSLCSFVKQSIGWMNKAPKFDPSAYNQTCTSSENEAKSKRKKTYSQEEPLQIFRDEFIRHKLRCR